MTGFNCIVKIKGRTGKHFTAVFQLVIEALLLSSQIQMSVLYEVCKPQAQERVNVSLKGQLCHMKIVFTNAQRLRVNTYVMLLIAMQHVIQ